MNHRVSQDNRPQENGVKKEARIKGVHIVRFLVGGLLVLNFFLIYAILFSSHGIQGYRRQNEQVRELEEKILKLKTENQKLFEMIQSLKADRKAQEKLVREELGWVRENEMVLDIPEFNGESGPKHGGAKKPAGPGK
ncbi:MAG: septum formation initiator family protein [Desulfobacteraceae bacterium]|nr:septum formation initiator family protein [Desulfobacteraceae bacterium]